MPITSQEVEHVAHLSRLSLTGEELAKFAVQLDAILRFVDKLNELDTSAVEPMVHAVEGVQPTRADEVRPSLPREAALANAPDRAEGFFRVPRIIE